MSRQEGAHESYGAQDDNGHEEVYDLVGVGVGPFNLSLAALADGFPGLRKRFFDAKPEFSWHPGLLLEGAQLQVPFLADLVTLVDPTSPWSFLNYLRAHERLFPFYFSERFHIPRREYDRYCRWVSERLPSCRFGKRVASVQRGDDGMFRVTTIDVATERVSTTLARNVVMGVGTTPTLPAAFADLEDDKRVFHAGSYLEARHLLAEARHITVVGSGQSGAEVLLDLLQGQPEHGARLHWLTRSPAFAPMEYSKLGLEHFTPDYIEYFRSLPPETRDRLVGQQWQLYKGISADTIAEIHDVLYERSIDGRRDDVVLMPQMAVEGAVLDADGRIRLTCRHQEQDETMSLATDGVVLATGYSARMPSCLDPLQAEIDHDHQGRYQVDGDYRVALHPSTDGGSDGAVRGGLYVQNAELHTHGVGAPDLGLGAFRSARILNAIAATSSPGAPTPYPLPTRSAFTTFGVRPPN